MTARNVSLTIGPSRIFVELTGSDIGQSGCTLFVAEKAKQHGGCALVPFDRHREGSTLFLPHRVDSIYAAQVQSNGSVLKWSRQWFGTRWSEPLPITQEFDAHVAPGLLRLSLPANAAKLATWNQSFNRPAEHATSAPLIWAKDLTQNDGWGALLPFADGPEYPIIGDFALPRSAAEAPSADQRPIRLRWGQPAAQRTVIYQLLPRLFSNTNETRKPNGSIAENGVGKFAEITDTALAALRDEMGVTHIWLTGILSQATATDYSSEGKPADDPDLLKGLAGSPYAIKDYGDVCPDYAVEPAKRMQELKALIERAHRGGLRVIIDLVANHVARSHQSNVVEFGRTDNTSVFFSPENNFFWLQPDSPGGGAPLKLPTAHPHPSPTCSVLGHCDGLFDAEREHARVTGNNAATWSPSVHDWYETVKLNYGFDFTTGQRRYPHGDQPDFPIPSTWKKMDAVLSFWQGLGVDGFRCDMAHMVPPEFWQWALDRARERQPNVLFVAEAYNDDPMKVSGGDPFVRNFDDVSIDLLNAGFDAVYHAPPYKALKRIYDGPAWANDVDASLGVRDAALHLDYVFHRALHFAENHDEVRFASHHDWAGLGMNVGRPVSGILFALSRGPVLFYSGQEVGEPAEGVEGFGGDDGRTTIFDYWSMPEFTKWVNGHRYDGARLSPEQRELRTYYGRLLKLLQQPALRDGEFLPLNVLNTSNPRFGRLPNEPASGHWLYAFLRTDSRSGQTFLIAANLHPTSTLNDVIISLPAPTHLLFKASGNTIIGKDRLNDLPATTADLVTSTASVPTIPPLTAGFWCFQAHT